jgi:hypothetical protein
MILPTTLGEAEAKLAERYARDWVVRCSTEDLLEIGIPVVHATSEHVFALLRQFLKHWAMADGCQMVRIIHEARNGCAHSREAMRELIVELRNRRQELPLALDAFCQELVLELHPPLHPIRSRGRAVEDQFLQDIAIVLLVLNLILRFPSLKPTGRSARRPSASRIAAAAFSQAKIRSLEPKTVEGIWARYLPAIGEPKHFQGLTVLKK